MSHVDAQFRLQFLGRDVMLPSVMASTRLWERDFKRQAALGQRLQISEYGLQVFFGKHNLSIKKHP